MEFQKTTFPFQVAGINLTLPIDRLPPNKYRLLENVRSYGVNCQGRQGISKVNSNTTIVADVHSMFSFDDPIPSPSAFPTVYKAHTRLRGIGTQLEQASDNINPVFFSLIETGFSGKPMSFTVNDSDQSPRPWTFIADFNKLRKVSSNATSPANLVGIAPPNFAPTAATSGPIPDGPDIGTTGVPYVYAFRARSDPDLNTGCPSNLGPAIRTVNGLSPSSAPGSAVPPSEIIVTVPAAHPDPQVRYLDCFRFGGSLTAFKYIGTCGNVIGQQIFDTFADADIAANLEAPGDDNQPYLSTDLSKSGTCTITSAGAGLGGTMTITAGDLLRPYDATGDAPYYLIGNQVNIDGTLFTFYRSPDSTTTVELLEDVTPRAGVGYSLESPTMAHQPLPCTWGPFGGGSQGVVNFGVGDALNSGAIYWTKGNHPESHPAANSLNITSAAEPLMNGQLYNGNSYVFSTLRMFVMYPTLGGNTDFIALECPNSKGLFARWGICTTPQGIAFIAKDGIYITSGGAPVSITDTDLYTIFPHEGESSSAFPNIDGLLNASFNPPQFAQPDSMRLAYGDGFLYFDYTDTGGVERTLLYEFASKCWISRDSYDDLHGISHYYERFEDNTTQSLNHGLMLMGLKTGDIAEYSGTSDFGNAISGEIRTGSFDTGDSRPRKLWGDVEIDIDSQCDTLSIEAGLDNFTYFSALAASGLNFTGRRRAILDINAGQGQYAYNLGLDISWTASTSIPIVYFWGPSWVPKPELTALRVTDWDDCGVPGAKFIQGFKLRADTLNQPRTVQVLSDGGAVVQTFTIQHANEVTKPYVFATPFISHLVRLAPTDANFWRIEGIEWIFNPVPELVTVYTTPMTTHDLNGWFSHGPYMYIPLVSSDVVTLAVNTLDNSGSPFLYTIPSTGSMYIKNYLTVTGMKCKSCQYSLTSPAGFRLFVQDAETLVKQWGSPGPYVSKNPFGELSRTNGARI